MPSQLAHRLARLRLEGHEEEHVAFSKGDAVCLTHGQHRIEPVGSGQGGAGSGPGPRPGQVPAPRAVTPSHPCNLFPWLGRELTNTLSTHVALMPVSSATSLSAASVMSSPTSTSPVREKGCRKVLDAVPSHCRSSPPTHVHGGCTVSCALGSSRIWHGLGPAGPSPCLAPPSNTFSRLTCGQLPHALPSQRAEPLLHHQHLPFLVHHKRPYPHLVGGVGRERGRYVCGEPAGQHDVILGGKGGGKGE